jgi:hypothetical protein
MAHTDYGAVVQFTVELHYKGLWHMIPELSSYKQKIGVSPTKYVTLTAS